MASISSNCSFVNIHRNPIFLRLSSPSILSVPFHVNPSHRFNLSVLKIGPYGVRTGSSTKGRDSYGADAMKKPVSTPLDAAGGYLTGDSDSEDEGGIDWEDQILEDTVPLVGFVRMLLHSDKYKSGERLSPEHERIILDRLLPYHPECEKKIGSGVDYITVGYHPDFEGSRCLFIVRKNGDLEDFSYWKCIKGFIRKNYPLYADSFILRHFRKRRHYD